MTGPRSQEIIDYVAKQKQPVRPRQVAQALGNPYAATTMNRLAIEGLLDKVEWGLYATPQDER